MKKIKKSLMATFLVAAMLFCTFANTVPASAATLTADQYLKKMGNALNKAKSYESTTTSVQNVVADGTAMKTKKVQKFIFFANPLKSKDVTTTTMRVNGKSSKAKTYTYIKKNAKGELISYVSLDGKKYDKMNISTYVDSLSSLDTSMYSNAKIVKTNVKVNNVNTVKISAQITGENMGKALESAFAGLSIDDESGSAIDYSEMDPVKATIWVDKKTYRPVKISTDTTAFLNCYMAVLAQSMPDVDMDEAGNVSILYTEATSTVTYTKYNKATNFKLPKACK